jgi:hypothetical protein
MNYVPFQKCPICEGLGYYMGIVDDCYRQIECPTCEGERIIPMCPIEPNIEDLVKFNDDNLN